MLIKVDKIYDLGDLGAFRMKYIEVHQTVMPDGMFAVYSTAAYGTYKPIAGNEVKAKALMDGDDILEIITLEPALRVNNGVIETLDDDWQPVTELRPGGRANV